MKKICSIALIALLVACSGASTNKNSVDTMNGINQNAPLDTTVGPQQDGYNPPNTKTDTSQRLKDSIDTSHKH